MSVINNNLLLTPEGYQISRSVRLRSSASAYFNRTPASAGNRQTWTWSGWVKRGTLATTTGYVFGAGSDASNFMGLRFGATQGGASPTTDGLQFLFVTGGVDNTRIDTSQVFRDPSAWYHIIVALDTTQAAAANRIKLYVNGVQVTSFAVASYPTQNSSWYINNAVAQGIGYMPSLGQYFDGYLTEVNFIDGQALTPASFGETDVLTGVWKPKKYSGTYGTNGFYLNFSDNSAATAAAIGKDWSGNGNNWTPNNISVTAGVTYDSMLDVPTMYADGGNGRGNYCVLSPIDRTLTDGSITNGNLTLTGISNWNACRATFGVSSGQWYWETVHSVYNQSLCGIADSAWPTSTNYPGFSSTGYSAAYGQNATKYVDGVNSSYGATFTIGDVIGYALDMDAGTLTCYKNGVSQGTMVTGLTAYGTIFPAIAAANGAVINANFGQRPFAYTTPTGFKALNTQNLPEATIKKGGSYFNTVLYTGNAGSKAITGVGFQPDLVWGKTRSIGGNNRLHDSARGSDNTLSSNLTDAEASGNGLVSFDADGFTMDSGTNINQAYTYVAWNWKESASAGFDIVTYTGTSATRTVAHSLGVKPAMIIVKSRNAPSGGYANWNVTHQSLNMANQAMYLNGTQAAFTDTDQWGNTQPTSSVFTLGANSASNNSIYTYVAYLFAEVAGFSKFGSYVGNGSADGVFVYTGFRPRYIMVKRTDGVSDWSVHDTARDTYNASLGVLYPDTSGAEAFWPAGQGLDLLSNGFKLRNTGAGDNASGGTYIFAAFAENPFKNSLAR